MQIRVALDKRIKTFTCHYAKWQTVAEDQYRNAVL